MNPKRVQTALLFGLIPIVFLANSQASFNRGGAIRLLVSVDERFVAIHHLLPAKGIERYFDRFRILDRINGRLFPVPRRCYLWHDHRRLKEIDGRWFLAIANATAHLDRCWVQRFDKEKFVWEKPRWLPGHPVAWANGKIVCVYQQQVTLVDENDNDKEVTLLEARGRVESLGGGLWYAIAKDEFLLFRLDSKVAHSPYARFKLSGQFAGARVDRDELVVWYERPQLGKAETPLFGPWVFEKRSLQSGEEISSKVFSFGNPSRYAKVLGDFHDSQCFAVWTPWNGICLFDLSSSKIVFRAESEPLEETRCLNGWICMEGKKEYKFLNPRTFAMSRSFPFDVSRRVEVLPLNDNQYLKSTKRGELEIRDFASDKLLQVDCSHRGEFALRILLLTYLVAWIGIWTWNRKRIFTTAADSKALAYVVTVAGSLACLIIPLYVLVKLPGVEEEFGVLVNRLMSGVITGMLAASWIGLWLGESEWEMRVFYFCLAIFAASGAMLHQQEYATYLFHATCLTMIAAMLLPLLIARRMHWRISFVGFWGPGQGGQGWFQWSILGLMALGASCAILLQAVRYDPYMAKVYAHYLPQSVDWRAILILGFMLALVSLAQVQLVMARIHLAWRVVILASALCFCGISLLELAGEFSDPRLSAAAQDGYFLASVAMHIFVLFLYGMPLRWLLFASCATAQNDDSSGQWVDC